MVQNICLALLLCTLTPSIAMCSLSLEDKRQPTEQGPTAPYALGEQVGVVGNPLLEEISGIVASESYKDCFWVHNDSGDEANIYLIDLYGELRAVAKLPLEARDWEDISYGDGYIYIGEIGDNFSQYPDKKIYRLKEPQIELNSQVQSIEIEDFETMSLTFSDSQRDSETLMWDPVSRELALITKREEQVLLYTTPFIATTDKESITLKPQATLDITLATAGDISPKGDKILIKNYTDIYLWQREGSEPLAQILETSPTRLEYEPEPQGEAIAWHRTLDKFYTISEKVGRDSPIIYEYVATP